MEFKSGQIWDINGKGYRYWGPYVRGSLALYGFVDIKTDWILYKDAEYWNQRVMRLIEDVP